MPVAGICSSTDSNSASLLAKFPRIMPCGHSKTAAIALTWLPSFTNVQELGINRGQGMFTQKLWRFTLKG
eukprot:1157627-Pelagomonas_calceolata.AAC.12